MHLSVLHVLLSVLSCLYERRQCFTLVIVLSGLVFPVFRRGGRVVLNEQIRMKRLPYMDSEIGKSASLVYNAPWMWGRSGVERVNMALENSNHLRTDWHCWSARNLGWCGASIHSKVLVQGWGDTYHCGEELHIFMSFSTFLVLPFGTIILCYFKENSGRTYSLYLSSYVHCARACRIIQRRFPSPIQYIVLYCIVV